MSGAVDVVLVLVLLSNFLMLGQSRVRAAIRCAAAQGILLGVALVLVHGLHPGTLVLAAVSAGLKGITIPSMLLGAMSRAGIRREVEPLVGYVPTLLLGGAGTALSLLFAGTLPLAPGHEDSLIVPASLATVLTGFLMLTTRRKAITQVVGYLTLENGIFIFGLLLLDAMPFIVETGVLLDLVVGIFVMGIVLDQITREFSTLDTENLATLRD